MRILMPSLLVCCSAFAQDVPLPHEIIEGDPIAAHHVRLEGSVAPIAQWALLRSMQRKCAELNGKTIEPPAQNTVLHRVIEDLYYTEAHLITFKKQIITSINTRCEIESKESETIDVMHPYGQCKINPEKSLASGQCAARYSRAPKQINTSTQDHRSLGFDVQNQCKRTEIALGQTRGVFCIRPTSESWQSLRYNGGGDMAGLRITYRSINPANEIMIDTKAIQVNKNTSVGRGILSIAMDRGYRIIEVGN